MNTRFIKSYNVTQITVTATWSSAKETEKRDWHKQRPSIKSHKRATDLAVAPTEPDRTERQGNESRQHIVRFLIRQHWLPYRPYLFCILISKSDLISVTSSQSARRVFRQRNNMPSDSFEAWSILIKILKKCSIYACAIRFSNFQNCDFFGGVLVFIMYINMNGTPCSYWEEPKQSAATPDR